jgi:hypothetical protein
MWGMGIPRCEAFSTRFNQGFSWCVSFEKLWFPGLSAMEGLQLGLSLS